MFLCLSWTEDPMMPMSGAGCMGDPLHDKPFLSTMLTEPGMRWDWCECSKDLILGWDSIPNLQTFILKVDRVFLSSARSQPCWNLMATSCCRSSSNPDVSRVVPFRPLTLEDYGIKIPWPWQLPFTFSTYSTWDLFTVSYLLFQDCVSGFVSVHCMAFFWAPSPTLIHTYPSHSCHPREKIRRWSSTQTILDLQIPFLPAAEGV